MKTFSFISSVVALAATLISFFIDFPDLNTFNGIVYFAMLVILAAICITGIIINRPNRSDRIRIHLKH